MKLNDVKEMLSAKLISSEADLNVEVCSAFACDLMSDVLAFVEVKLRKSDAFAEAREFVSFSKQDRLKKTAAFFLADFGDTLQPRFDVIEIYAPFGADTKKTVIIHLEGAFE